MSDHPDAGRPWADAPGDPGTLTPAAAYRLGHAEAYADHDAKTIGGRHTTAAAREAVRSWTAAASDHGHASYWGAAHIRAMRAYWLGVLRGCRHRDTDAGCGIGYRAAAWR